MEQQLKNVYDNDPDKYDKYLNFYVNKTEAVQGQAEEFNLLYNFTSEGTGELDKCKEKIFRFNRTQSKVFKDIKN